MKVLMIINSLDIGGAEMSLETLSYALNNQIQVEVISLSGSGNIAQRLKDTGIVVHELELRANRVLLNQYIALFSLIRKIKPDIVHTWMYHSNFFGGVIARLAGVKKIIWSVHAFNISKGMLKFRTRTLIKCLALFSYFIPSRIICCSQKSLDVHRQLGYHSKKLVFIPNGVNTRLFSFSEESREAVRNELGIDGKQILVGCIGRYDVQKNQLGFLQTISYIKSMNLEYHFVFVGRGNSSQNKEICDEISSRNLSNNITLLGERQDISSILSALDIFAMPSKGEAFPVSLCEAMACEIPCIASNVGDIQLILGNISQAIDLKKFDTFAEAIIELGSETSDSRKQLGIKLKQRVAENFSIDIVAQLHEELYDAI
jgi:glycosyltransferase involved in cell wall biosynthesis